MKLQTFLSSIIGVVCAASIQLHAADIINFDTDWKFQLDEQSGAEVASYDDDSWRELHLPHDWSIEGEYDEKNPSTDRCGYLPAGIGWYRKTIEVPQAWKGKQVEIAFDGVFMNSTVWVNGKELGTRPYGWVSFDYDITDAVAKSDTLTIAVRVDNDKQPSARWYTGSGIYANTWIKLREAVHVPTSGVFVRTKNNSDILVDTEVVNKGKTAKGALITSVLNPTGAIVASHRESFTLKAGGETVVKQQLQVQNPDLWSLETPNLHTVVTQVKLGNEIVDTVETRFGMREVEWIAETGMWINGKNVKMQGACLHNDAGAMGSAIPDKILRFRVQQLKDMGCNAIRTGHKVLTPQFYDYCDEIGMLVMDEFFDGWMKKAEHDYGAHAFDDWWKRDLEDLIKRDRNHPSIVIYSVGNETHGDVGKEMVAFCHEVDDTRPVTSGNCEPEDMDVYGVNGGSEAKTFFDTLDTGGKVFIGTENPHTWHNRGFYRTEFWYRDGYLGKKGREGRAHYYPNLTMDEIFTYDWTDGDDRTHARQTLRSDYDNSSISVTVRHNIQKLRDIPHFAGSFRWTAYDYLGEARYHGGWPFKSFSGGAMDLANFEKNLFYLYQSQWTHKPMVHILPHWTHPTMKEGVEIPVWVYSNCDEVELFFNGKSLGKQAPGRQHTNMQCEWMVGWKPGELKAIGTIDGVVVQEQVVRTANAPTQIKLSIDGEGMADQARDIVQVRVSSADAQGTFYPYGENRTYFHVLGSGKVRALDNGSPLDVEKHFEAESRIGFFGLTRAYIESTDAEGGITLLASSIVGEKRQVTSNNVSIDTKLLLLRGSLPDVDIQVYYTTDGSVPTQQSAHYTEPFEVALGSTVKALVLVNGEVIHQMEERFAADAGFSWKVSEGSEVAAGEQAESAKFAKAKVSNAGKNYNGKGFIVFDSKQQKDGFVEWYFENDRSAGEFDLAVRYSSAGSKKSKSSAKLSVNGKAHTVKLIPSKHYREDWQVFRLTAKLGAGANYIKLIPLDEAGLCVDELIIK